MFQIHILIQHKNVFAGSVEIFFDSFIYRRGEIGIIFIIVSNEYFHDDALRFQMRYTIVELAFIFVIMGKLEVQAFVDFARWFVNVGLVTLLGGSAVTKVAEAIKK